MLFLLTGLPAGTISAWLVFAICNIVLVGRYRPLFTTCCGRGKLAERSAVRLQRMMGKKRGGRFSSGRVTLACFVLLGVWCALLVALVTGKLGGEHTYLMWPEGLLFYGLACLHLILFETATTAFRGWEESS